MKFTGIGNVPHEYGQDYYMLVKLEDDDFEVWNPSFDVQEQMVMDALHARYYRETSSPGTWYVTEFDVIRKPYTDEFIAIVKGRYDV